MSVRVALCLIGSLLLSACGGGAGGGGGGGSSGGFTIQLQQSSVSLEYREGAPTVASTSVTATWQGTPPNPLYVIAAIEGPGIAAPSITVNQVDARATITALRMPAGEYSGRIVIRACPDPACSSTVGGTPINLPYTMRVTPPIFSVAGGDDSIGGTAYIDYLLGQPAPTRTLNIAANSGSWTATATQPWITLSQTSGAGAASLVVTLRPELLSITQRLEGSVTVSTSTQGAQTYNTAVLMNRPAVQSSPAYMSVSGVAGAPLSLSQQVTLQLGGDGTLPIASVIANQPWVQISSISGQSFQVSLDSSVTALPSGTYSGVITVTLEGGAVDVEYQMPVQLALARAAFTTPATIVLGGASGRDFSDVSVPLSLNTGPNAYPWTLTIPPSWVNVNRISGNVSASGDTLTFQPIRGSLTPGLVTTSLMFSATINGEVITRTVPVEFAIDKRRLIADQVGIAFTELPGTNYDQLSRTLEVRDNYGESVAWAADDDAAWLTVTASGSSGDDLVVTADTTGLTADQLYTARVRITTNESTIDDEEYVRVGLWVGSSMPVANRELTEGLIPEISGDPIRPYVYTHSLAQPYMRVYNVYTGAVVATVNGIPSETRDITVSKDGQTLYLLASNNVTPVNLTTYAVGPTMVLSTPPSNRIDLIYARPNGVGVLLDVLLDGVGAAHLAATGEFVGSGAVGPFALSGDDRLLFEGDARYSVDFNQARQQFVRTQTGILNAGDNWFTRYVAANFDGSRVYMTRSPLNADRRFIMFNGQTLGSIVELMSMTQFLPEPRMTSRDQMVMFGSGMDDVRVYNPDNSLALSGVDLPELDNDRSVSGDGNFVLASTLGSSVWVIPIPR